MLVQVPIFNDIYIRNFQGIEEKRIPVPDNVSVILFKPVSGKSSFVNSVVFLYYGDIKYFDNYKYFYTLESSEVLGMIFNNKSTNFSDLEISNDYLKVTASSDTSVLSETDKWIVDEYVVKCIFTRTISKEVIEQYVTNTQLPKIVIPTTDYSYLCYDENKVVFEPRFSDLSKYFVCDCSTTNSTIEEYNYIRNSIRKMFDIDVFVDTKKNKFTYVKNGKVIHTPSSTIELTTNLLSSVVKPVSSVILVDNTFLHLTDEQRSTLFSSITEKLYSLPCKKKVVFLDNNTEISRWKQFLPDENVVEF